MGERNQSDRLFMHTMHPHSPTPHTHTRVQKPPVVVQASKIVFRLVCTYDVRTYASPAVLPTATTGNAGSRLSMPARLPVFVGGYGSLWQVRWEERSRRAVLKPSTSDSCFGHDIATWTPQAWPTNKYSKAKWWRETISIDTIYAIDIANSLPTNNINWTTADG